MGGEVDVAIASRVILRCRSGSADHGAISFFLLLSSRDVLGRRAVFDTLLGAGFTLSSKSLTHRRSSFPRYFNDPNGHP